MSENNIQLGEANAYPDKYDPSLLMPIPREQARQKLGEGGLLQSMLGKDIWHAYELSWLSASGKPQVAQGVFEFDCISPAIIESKSFKYYLNSYNQTCVASRQELQQRLSRDLSAASGAPVRVSLEAVGGAVQLIALQGFCVDQLEADDFTYSVDRGLLSTDASLVVNDTLYSHLLKSNCPVTGQPDWATLWLQYTGKKINPLGFLKYLVSYRQHQDFHENCIERIYSDVLATCQPEKLSVYARYTRRGGLDINPFRSNHEAEPPKGFRISRQ